MNVDSISIAISMTHMPDSRNWFTSMPSLRRRHFPRTRADGKKIHVGGLQLINFASNDYLGLSHHPRVVGAAQEALGRHGLGSGASRLVCGDAPVFHELEQALAEWKGYEAALLVGSGMLANIGLLHALAGRHDVMFTDRLNHASLVDGARLSGARVRRFPHRDTKTLEALLESTEARRRIIVTDGIFSMDGDMAPLTELRHLAEKHDALLIVDDAHGIGTLPDPRGACAMAGLSGHERLVEIGTFGKAFGGYGAFILGSQPLIDGLRQRLRTMIYSTALPYAIAQAMLVALDLIREGTLTARLQRNIGVFRRCCAGIPVMTSETAIQPVMLGDDTRALNTAKKLREKGFFVPAIRPPTVPEGTSRLRITLSSHHEAEEIRGLAEAIRDCLHE